MFSSALVWTHRGNVGSTVLHVWIYRGKHCCWGSTVDIHGHSSGWRHFRFAWRAYVNLLWAIARPGTVDPRRRILKEWLTSESIHVHNRMLWNICAIGVKWWTLCGLWGCSRVRQQGPEYAKASTCWVRIEYGQLWPSEKTCFRTKSWFKRLSCTGTGGIFPWRRQPATCRNPPVFLGGLQVGQRVVFCSLESTYNLGTWWIIGLRACIKSYSPLLESSRNEFRETVSTK